MSMLNDGDGQLIHVLIGQVHVARAPHVLFAVLGSCVGVSIIDTRARLGGMVHVLLPSARGEDDPGFPGKYADRGVDCLIDCMLAKGALLDRMVAYVAGGAALTSDTDPNAGIGAANAAMAVARLDRRRIFIAERFLGGKAGRKVTMRTACWEHQVELLRPTDPPAAAGRAREGAAARDPEA
jgi:chemotaxis protein CheD